jgi:hypothetical protein
MKPEWQEILDRHKDINREDDFRYLLEREKLPEDFIEYYFEKLGVDLVLVFQKLSEDFILRHYDDINYFVNDEETGEIDNCWKFVFMYQDLSEEFLRRPEVVEAIRGGDSFYFDFWESVALNQKLSEQYIRDNNYKLPSATLCLQQDLSEKYMRDFKSTMNWYNIARRQKMSDEFMEEFEDELEPFIEDYYLENPYADPKIKVKYMKAKGIIRVEHREDISQPASSIVRKQEKHEGFLKDLEDLEDLI